MLYFDFDVFLKNDVKLSINQYEQGIQNIKFVTFILINT